jgi:Flp pilus assembly pilin Flp
MFQAIGELWHDEEGMSTVEYALLLVLIVIVGVAAWQALGHTVSNQVTSVGNTIASAS